MSELNDFLERMSDKYPEIMDIKRFPTTDSVLDYLDKKGDSHRNICLIPESAHGTMLRD